MDTVLAEQLATKHYQIITELGRGTTGTTYRGQNQDQDTDVAIKVVSLRGVRDWKVIELFEREAKVLASLDHPHIPKYVDYFTIDTDTDIYFCLVQQLASGKSLDKFYDEGWQPEEEEITEIAKQVMEALVYLHSLSPPVIHRDIKPQNIIYDPEHGRAFLIDFGSVQDVYRNTFSYGLTLVGTLGFTAPEQYLGQVSFASDLYSLAATLVYLITGINPADLPQKRMVVDWRRLAKVNISPKLGQWLDELLQPIPEHRPVSTKRAFTSLTGTNLPEITEPEVAVTNDQKSKACRVEKRINTTLKARFAQIKEIEVYTNTKSGELEIIAKGTAERSSFLPPPTSIGDIFVSVVLSVIVGFYVVQGFFVFLLGFTPFIDFVYYLLPVYLVYRVWLFLINLFYFGSEKLKKIDTLYLSLEGTHLKLFYPIHSSFLWLVFFESQRKQFTVDVSKVSAIFPCRPTVKGDRRHPKLKYGLRAYEGAKVVDLFDNHSGMTKELAHLVAEEVNSFLGLEYE
ncbi:MAG: serine/threonine-protein kinase [Pseudanabaenaceae cyanobacterium SKYGB_i_bin29]|nr:serine/threonine protein kinase [Pseudanabaenaceae cyanobacterium SKYG29]MDW8422335.1 serine/threonine-protein kinase [Pseudanabaenaceae cyanobacterium SKYGB_i_bin29]